MILSVLCSVAVVMALATIQAATVHAATTPKAAPASGGRVAESVESAVYGLATKSYRPSYGGMAVTSDGTKIAIYLTNPAPDIEHAFEKLAPAGTLVFLKTPHSLQQLGTVHTGLRQQWNALLKQGINVNQFGPDIQTGQEDIGVVNLTASQAARLDSMFGTGMVHVYNMTQAQAQAIHALSSRINDTAPYNGGDAIINSAHTAGCSSGFGVLINGAPRLLTAAHCFPIGTNVRNGWWEPGNKINGSNADMGKVSEQDLSVTCCNSEGGDEYNGYDTEVFTGCNTSGTCGGDNLIWTGAIGAPGRTVVSGKEHWGVGDQVCTDGAYGGEVCGQTITKYDYCLTYYDGIDSYHTCSLTEISAQNTAVPGDSGGPVYRITNGNVYAVGTVTAGDGTGDVWFTGIYKILSIWGATLITG